MPPIYNMAESVLQQMVSRGSKRLPEQSPLDEMNHKRSRPAAVLEQFSQSDQLVLQAAAIILGTTLERVLSLSAISRRASTRTSSSQKSSRKEGSSVRSFKSGSNGIPGDITPPGSSDSERPYGEQPAANFAAYTSAVNLALDGQQTLSPLDQSTVEFDIAGMGMGDTHTDTGMGVFTTTIRPRQDMYPSPPTSHSDQNLTPRQDMLVDDFNDVAASWVNVPSHHQLGQDTYSHRQMNPLPQPPPAEQGGQYLDHLSLRTDLPNFGFLNPGGYDPRFPVNLTMNQMMYNPESIIEDKKMPVNVSAEAAQTEFERTSGTKGKRRGPFSSREQRELTALTRKHGACIRCSILRVRCEVDEQNPAACCKNCRQVLQKGPLWAPCLRYKITDSELLDNAKCPRPTWTSRWDRMEMIDIKDWASDEVKTIQVTQGVGSTWYALKVRQFKPVEGDFLARKWVADGQKHEYVCTPYAVANMREAGKVLTSFCEGTLKVALQYWLANGDALLRKTYLMAYRYSSTAENESDRVLLKFTMRLWGASRMMSRSAWICGEETLGMTGRDYGPNSPSTNRVLMPPVFSAQMEIIFVSMILEPTKKEVLSRLKALIQDKNRSRKSWLAIYLCIFLLLHSCALMTARDNERARLQGASGRFYRPRVIEELHNGAKILLAYFHHCNQGSYPLYMDWTSEDQMFLADIKKEQAEFLQFTVQEYKKKAQHFREILDNNVYEDQYYFIAQMYERDWKPRHTKHTV